MSGWKIARIGGIDVRIDRSFAFVAILFTFNFWLVFSDPRFALAAGAAVGMAVLTAALFFGSILLHELAHAGVDRLLGIPVAGISLWMLGGMTLATREARRPGEEFLVSAAGPASSAVLGLVFLTAGRLAGVGGSVGHMLRYLAGINLLLAIFNLLPAFPLDGGRVLRSGLWRATGNAERATRWAARSGQVTGLLIIGTGVAFAARQGVLAVALWPALIGWFLYRWATDALASEGRRRVLGAKARDVMSPPPPAIPANLPVRAAVDGYLAGHPGESFPVMEDGQVLGFVSIESVSGSDPDRPVREAMVGAGGAVQASADEAMHQVLERLREHRATTVLVVDDGRLVGVIQEGDLRRYAERGAPGPGGEASAPGPPARPDV